MGSDRRALLVGLGLLVFIAAVVGALPKAGRPAPLEPRDVVVASAPGAVVPRADFGALSDYPPCNVVPSTGHATVFYRIVPADDWTKLDFSLCHPPGFRPGAVTVSFRSPDGAQFQAAIPVDGWVPGQRWRGSDAQIGFHLAPTAPQWLAWDSALPCRIRTESVRRFFTAITAFHGEPTENGKVMVGGSVRASFSCSHLPLLRGTGPPVDLHGELTVSNCEGGAQVVPPPAIPTECPSA